MFKRISVISVIAAVLSLLLAVVYLFNTYHLEISSFKVLFNNLFRGGIASPNQQFEDRLQLPEGFYWSRYAEGLTGARMMVMTGAEDLLVSLPRKGQIWRIAPDRDNDGRADDRELLLDNLDRPHGLALKDHWLYIAERDAVRRIAFDHQSGSVSGAMELLIDGLPGGGNHWSKSIGFGPDNRLYLSIGSSCNVCVEKDARRATMMRFTAEGGQGEVIATGLRNSVGFDWAPWNEALYATDNGRDLLGDNYPPDELNRIENGRFYGWPYINGFGDPDPDLGEGQAHRLAEAVSPEFGFRAHNAPLGIYFNRSNHLPDRFQSSAFVALHGSWNRSIPDGYKVISLHWDGSGAISAKDFMTGFEQKGSVIGRPVDIVQNDEGVLFISDDYSGSIYRVEYRGLNH